MLNKFYNNLLKLSFFKKFNLNNTINIEYSLLKSNQILFLNSANKFNFFLFLPNHLHFFFFKNTIFFFFQDNLKFSYKLFFFFFFNLKYYLKQLKSYFYQTLYIKGTNYKINFLENTSNVLKLKLGYSHLIYLTIPTSIKLKLFKKKLVIKSLSNLLLGNFCFILFNYRPINIFTGKGLLIKSRKKFKLKQYSKKI